MVPAIPMPDETGVGRAELAEVRELFGRVGAPASGDDRRTDQLLEPGSGAVDRWGTPVPPPPLDHDRIRDADPLGLDPILARLTRANRAADTAVLLGWLSETASRGEAELEPEDATAALRDVGMLMGSLRRFGLEPVAEVPALEPLLLAWGTRTGMVPRDTVVHYGLWNPVGARERRFVDDEGQEAALIDSVRRSCRLLPLAGIALELAWEHELTTPTGLAGLELTRDAVTEFAAVFARTRAIVSPQFFAQQLRPFFDPVIVGGTAYNGPAAAFIPLYLVDELLWGGGAELEIMHREALVYARPQWRRARDRVADHPPVAVELERRDAAATSPDPALTRALESADAAVRALLRFRGQHVTTARQAYAYEVTPYVHGSGGFAPGELKQVADEERAAATTLDGARRHDGRRAAGWAS